MSKFEDNEENSINDAQLLTQCESQLNKTIIQISSRIKKLDLNFNMLKNELFSLTKQFEMSKGNNQLTTIPSENNKIDYNEKLKEFLIQERENNINQINESLSKYLNEDSVKLSPDDIVTHDKVNNLQSDIDIMINQLHDKIKNMQENRQSTISTMQVEMSKECERINKLVSFFSYLFLYWKKLLRIS